MNRILSVFRVMRPHQWVKNTFVFLPLFFSGDLLDGRKFLMTCVVFLAFSFAASAVYCLNDMMDVEADRSHPRKCRRPFASGELSRSFGGFLMVVLLLLAAGALRLPVGGNTPPPHNFGGYRRLCGAECGLLSGA